MRNVFEEKAIELIKNLTQSQFDFLCIKTLGKDTWSYVGSGGKNSGDDAHWMRFHNGSVEIITSSTYGNDQEYYLVQETIMDLNTLKNVADSVISFGDATSNGTENPETEEGLANIINGIAFSLSGHGGHNETVINPSLVEEAKRLSMKVSDELVDKLFAEVAERYDIPFKG